MATCELCGKTETITIIAEIAGTQMNVCNSCKKMGKVIDKDEQPNRTHSFKKKKKQDIKLEVVPNFAPLVNSALAKKSMNLHQLARVLNIKESTLNKYFTGKIKPDILTAKKLERYFEINLLQEASEINVDDYLESEEEKEERSQGLSLGDLIKKKFL